MTIRAYAPDLYSAHGLLIRCDDVSLDLRPAASTDDPDVTFRLTEAAPVPGYREPVDGVSLAHFDHGAGSELSVVRRADGGGATGPHLVDVCFHGVALATIDRSAHEVQLTLAPDADPGLAAVLIGGTLISVYLTLLDHPVLHASAVVVGDGPARRAIAVVGRSGMGKSTMATLLCRDGARLLADDVLRTDLAHDSSVIAWPGATATRLRRAAEALGHQAAADRVSTTADGRLAAALGLAGSDPVRLGALVVPYPDRSATDLRVVRLGGLEAVMALVSFPRILGWTDSASAGVAHRHWGELARRVPVLAAVVPWGPPFAEGVGRALLDAISRESIDLEDRKT